MHYVRILICAAVAVLIAQAAASYFPAPVVQYAILFVAVVAVAAMCRPWYDPENARAEMARRRSAAARKGHCRPPAGERGPRAREHAPARNARGDARSGAAELGIIRSAEFRESRAAVRDYVPAPMRVSSTVV